MNLNPEEYTFTAFNSELAQQGNPTAVLFSGGVITYKLCESFEARGDNYAYPFRVLVEGIYYDFNRGGQDADGHTIYMANGIIDSSGATAGDIQTKADAGGTEEYYSLTSLNYRENVAVQVLNALIGHIPNPLGYSNATIKLLIDKAFKFSVEFINQALNLRVSNAELNPETGDVVENSTSTIGALDGIAQQISNLIAQNTGIKNNIATVATKIDNGDDDIVEAIKTKVIIPETSEIVVGSVSESTFTPSANQISWTDARSVFEAGGLVVLKYTISNVDYYDAIIYASATTIRTRDNYYWYKP